MKKKLIITMITCLFIIPHLPSIADDNTEDAYSSLDAYDQYIEDSYKTDTSPSNAQMPVSDKEFNTAIRNVEKFGLPYKKRKELENKRKIEEQFEKSKAKALYVNPSPLALISLPISVKVSDTTLIPGFYLLDYRLDGEQEYIIIKQADQELGQVPVYESTNQDKKVIDSYAEIKSFEDNKILIELNTKVAKISFYLDKSN